MPIHVELVQAHGYNALFPILAMAGVGQIGAAIAVLMKTRNARLKKVIKGALPVGLLGIGEPLIFGVTLPLGKPFIGACLGGAVGGALISYWKVATVITFGISGLPLALTIVAGKVLFYLLGYLIAVIAGLFLPGCWGSMIQRSKVWSATSVVSSFLIWMERYINRICSAVFCVICCAVSR
ncbi:PTS system IIBC component [Salmonella enterica subsp. enterica serovar Typhimurium]|nr:PTS system IIBC component [Salmonella enterica subsp. enterica serovar Typhimurium]